MPALKANDAGLPEIDTREFEWFLEPWPSKLRRFRQRHPRFVDLVHKLVIELQLQGKIEHLKIHQSYFGRAELYREVGHQWPGPRVCLAIYKDRYMDKRLLRHELRHEADHWNPEMHYNPEIEQRWKDCWMSAVWRGGLWSPLNVAADISLDVRRGTGGLGSGVGKTSTERSGKNTTVCSRKPGQIRRLRGRQSKHSRNGCWRSSG